MTIKKFALIALLIITNISLACSCATWQPLDLQGKVIQSKYEDYSSIVLAKVEKVDKISIPEISTDGGKIKDDGEKTREA